MKFDRATIHLNGLPVGDAVVVDVETPSQPPTPPIPPGRWLSLSLQFELTPEARLTLMVWAIMAAALKGAAQQLGGDTGNAESDD